LANLLKLHPDVAYCRHPGEDFLLDGSRHLVDYVESVSARWRNKWKGMVVDQQKEMLWLSISDALHTYLAPESEAPFFLTKTPSSVGIESFHRLFPQGKLVLLVRDGRNLVESAVQSFGGSHEEWMQAYAKSLERIAWLREKAPEAGMVVRYEDLLLSPEETLRRIFEYVGLDCGRFDFGRVEELPVVGSCQSSAAKGTVDWNVDLDQSSADFRPLERFLSWSDETRKLYDRICGRVARGFGYEAFGVVPDGPCSAAQSASEGKARRFLRLRLVHLAYAFLGTRLTDRLRAGNLWW
jgi:hypothetical protein